MAHRLVPGSVAAVAAVAALAAVARPLAHEIPADVVVHVFVRPDGDRLRVAVRVPLAAMRDVDLPLRGPGWLELAAAEPALREAALRWILPSVAFDEEDRRVGAGRLVAVRAALPSDQSFASFDATLAHLTGPGLPAATELVASQALLDVLIDYPIASDRARFSIEPAFGRLGLRVVTIVRFVPPAGAERVFQLRGDPGLVRLDPRWHQAALGFVIGGIEHILGGVDHLLFLLCLVLPFRRLRELVLIATAFTVAHSVTLIASAYDLVPDTLWFPPLVEVVIAASIVYMAIENIVGATKVERRWALTFGFGLVHGFGFAFGLRETLQFAGDHVLTSLVAFNAGIEIGQVLVLVVLVPVLGWLFRAAVAERLGVIIISALVTHTAWHWMTERWTTLGEHWPPAWDPAAFATMLRWIIVIIVATVAVGWGSRRWGAGAGK